MWVFSFSKLFLWNKSFIIVIDGFTPFSQLVHQAFASPILYDFYNYEADKKEFNQLFVKFTQVIIESEICFTIELVLVWISVWLFVGPC